MNISDEETKDLKRLAKEYNLDFDELVEAYKKTSQPFDNHQKIDEAKEFEKNKQQVAEMTKRILNLKKENKDDDVETQNIDDQLEILEQTKMMRAEGLLPPESNEEED